MASSTTATAALALFAVGLAAAPLARTAHAVVQGPPRGAAVPSDIAYPGQSPWHAAVHRAAGKDANTLLGSGALVSQQYVLTAASILPQDESGLKVALGVITLSQTSTVVDVKQVKKHDQWSSAAPAANDLALLQLATPVILPDDGTIDVVPLPPWFYRGATYKDQSVTVSTWGTDSPDYQDMFLREIVLDVISNRDCASRHGVASMDASQLCAMQERADGDVILSKEDGGDPVVFTEPNGTVRLIGVVAAERQGSTQLPTVVTRLTEHLAWIAANSDALIEG